MPTISDWSLPFSLTSAVYSGNPLAFNTANAQMGTLFVLNRDSCELRNTVRATKEFIPEFDGAILHRRFAGGMEMDLAVQLWETSGSVACDDTAQSMLDLLNGYLYGLLNAGDNEGRLSWEVPDTSDRMLDDLRLLSYPTMKFVEGVIQVEFTVDTALPYAEDLTQLSPSIPGNVTNAGNRPTYPVWQIYGAFSSFTLTNTTNGDTFAYDDSQPGAPNIGGGDYIEIDTIRNTAFKNGDGANCLPGIVLGSDFFSIPPGTHAITCPGVGGASVALVNAAWA